MLDDAIWEVLQEAIGDDGHLWIWDRNRFTGVERMYPKDKGPSEGIAFSYEQKEKPCLQ